jgi:uncharacterized membrane protein
MNMNFRYLGTAIMALSIMSGAIVYSLSSAIISSTEHTEACSLVGTCPHVAALNLSYMGYIFSAGLFLTGLYVFMKAPQPGLRAKPKDLEPDEKKVYDMIAEAGGMVFQSDLVEKTGFPKARVTRILDRLEARRLLERRRRGMTNAVVLK